MGLITKGVAVSATLTGLAAGLALGAAAAIAYHVSLSRREGTR